MRDTVNELTMRVLPWVVAGIVLLFIVIFLWKIPELQLAPWKAQVDQSKRLEPKDFIKLENDLRATWAQVLAGCALLVGIYLTWRTYKLNREGQITERFSRAIDQLDYTNSLDVRIGGIYALERIAKDSKKDHWPIMEVLTAYVREHARWKKDQSPEEGQETKSGARAGAVRMSNEREPTPDVQGVLTVLGRRKRTFGRGEEEPLDLRATNLRGAQIFNAHLEWAILWEARLEGAKLWGAHLENARLWRAHLEGALLIRAHLKGADLEGAHLEGADLREATGLTQGQIDKAITDGETRLPEYLRTETPGPE